MTEATKVAVPGTSLSYEMTGSGPVLLLIHGGVMDSTLFKAFAPLLADRYTVVSYDRRGYGDSALEHPDQEQTIALHADDAHHLLAALTSERAHVVGLSSGAFVAMELATRHPLQVGTLVAFEPPLVSLLPDHAWFVQEGKETHELYRREGAMAALARFGAMVQDGDEEAPEPPQPADPDFMARLARNAEFFFAHEYLQYGDWRPDLDRLRARSEPTVIGVGDASGDQPARRAAHALADRLGLHVVEFPGDHGGMMGYAEEWATQLDELVGG